MTQTARGSQVSLALNGALGWLDSAPTDDPMQDLAPLRHHLRTIVGAGIDASQRVAVVHRLQRRADAVSRALRGLLHDSALPLAPRLNLVAQGLLDVHGLLAAANLRIARELSPSRLAQAGTSLAAVCARALGNLGEQQQIALLVASAPPDDMWRMALKAHSLLGACPREEIEDAEGSFRHMLALAAAQPETFSGNEIAFLIDYLHRIAPDVETGARPYGAIDSWYWLDGQRDQGPIAVTRRPPGGGNRVIYFSCAALAKRTDQMLHRLAEGEQPANLDLPSWAGTDDGRAVLAKAQSRWASPPRRRYHHRPSSYSVEICPEIERLWDLMRSGNGGDSPHEVPLPITKWKIFNESPGGFAMMHVSGAISGLTSGDALGLRISPNRPWNICLVRWARSNRDEQVELGLELIAPSAAPVQIVRRDDAVGARLSTALLLRPATHHHGKEVLLTRRSRSTAEPFTMIAEPNGKLRLTECQVQRLALQTARVEMLEFSRDYSPQ